MGYFGGFAVLIAGWTMLNAAMGLGQRERQEHGEEVFR